MYVLACSGFGSASTIFFWLWLPEDSSMKCVKIFEVGREAGYLDSNDDPISRFTILSFRDKCISSMAPSLLGDHFEVKAACGLGSVDVGGVLIHTANCDSLCLSLHTTMSSVSTMLHSPRRSHRV